MKKLFLFVAFAVLFIGCGKKASGTLSIENQSNYDVVCGIGEDYKSYDVSIPKGATKKIAWVQYILWYPKSPKNLISYKEADGKVVITDAFSNEYKPYKHIFKTNMANISLNNFYYTGKNGTGQKIDVDVLLNNESQIFKLKTTQTSLAQNSETEIYCVRKITAADVCIDRGALLTIAATDSASGKEEKCYTFTRDENGIAFFNKIEGDSPKQKIEKQEIRIKIDYTATCGYVEIKAPDKV